MLDNTLIISLCHNSVSLLLILDRCGISFTRLADNIEDSVILIIEQNCNANHDFIKVFLKYSVVILF